MNMNSMDSTNNSKGKKFIRTAMNKRGSKRGAERDNRRIDDTEIMGTMGADGTNVDSDTDTAEDIYHDVDQDFEQDAGQDVGQDADDSDAYLPALREDYSLSTAMPPTAPGPAPGKHDPLLLYLREINKYQLLSIEQERALTKALGILRLPSSWCRPISD
ncbi:MAG: hypothetical protein HQK53_11685 [Oligoflexia bacterium]|nr:hypothetical protein [Oligoflexia bacterium]